MGDIAAGSPLPEVRCPACHRLYFKGIYLAIEIMCWGCKYMFRDQHDPALPQGDGQDVTLSRPARAGHAGRQRSQRHRW